MLIKIERPTRAIEIRVDNVSQRALLGLGHQVYMVESLVITLVFKYLGGFSLAFSEILPEVEGQESKRNTAGILKNP